MMRVTIRILNITIHCKFDLVYFFTPVAGYVVIF